jgi:hypothetical protein
MDFGLPMRYLQTRQPDTPVPRARGRSGSGREAEGGTTFSSRHCLTKRFTVISKLWVIEHDAWACSNGIHVPAWIELRIE